MCSQTSAGQKQTTLTPSGDLLENWFYVEAIIRSFVPHLCTCLISLLHVSDSLINCAKWFLKLIITLLRDPFSTLGAGLLPWCRLIVVRSLFCAFVSFLSSSHPFLAFRESRNICMEGEMVFF